MFFLIKSIGALTSKAYAFTARVWELKNIDSIDILDSICSHIRIDYRNNQIMRILPKKNEIINEEWINDKIRFSYDSLSLLRIYFPVLKMKNFFIFLTWKDLLFLIRVLFILMMPFYQFNYVKFQGICGALVDGESVISFKDFFHALGLSNLNNNTFFFRDFRTDFRMFSLLTEIDILEILLIIGINPRLELPLINTKLRKNFLFRGLFIGLINFTSKLNFFFKHLGNTYKDLINILIGRSWFSFKFLTTTKALIFLSGHLLKLRFGFFFYSICSFFEKLLNIKTNFLYTQVGDLNCCELNCGSNKNFCNSNEEISLEKFYDFFELQYLLEQDKDTSKLENPFTIFQSHHGNFDFNYDLLIPNVSFFEKNSSYINIEGKLQLTRAGLLNQPGIAKTNWLIFTALGCAINSIYAFSFFLKNYLPKLENFSLFNLSYIRKRLYEISPNYDKNIFNIFNDFFSLKKIHIFKTMIGNSLILTLFNNFYKNDAISNSSKIMSNCVTFLINKFNNF